MKNRLTYVFAILFIGCSFQNDEVNPHQIQNPSSEDLLQSAILKYHHTSLTLHLLGTSEIIGTAAPCYGCSVVIAPLPFWLSTFGAGGSLPFIIRAIDKSKKESNGSVESIARILFAQSWMELSLAYGDVPFTSALRGHKTGNLYYDTQQTVLEENLRELEQAVLMMESSESKPLPSDLYFQGDLDQWTRYANGLLMKYYLILSAKFPEYLDKAYALIGKSMTSSSDNNALVDFQSPLYAISIERPRTFTIKRAFYDQLLSNNDPRSDSYVPDGNRDLNFIGSFWGDEYAPLSTFSYSEVKFLEAEIFLRKGEETLAEDAMKEGVKSNFEFMGFALPDYEEYMDQVNFSGLTTFEEKLSKLLTEKYFGVPFTGASGIWHDYRRTGFPTIIEELGLRQLPDDLLVTRYEYPDSEFETNETNVLEAIMRQGSGTGEWDDVLWIFDN